MEEFVEGSHLLACIKADIEKSSTFSLAVAYWGKGAVSQFGLDSLSPEKSGVIICDLMSGSCNPDEINKLITLKNSNLEILMLDNLHAKIYWTPKSVVVGSSNASANGIGFEGEEVSGVIEGNLRTTNPDVIETVRKWFEKNSKNAKPITKDHIQAAKKLWKKRRADRPMKAKKSESFIDVLRSEPWRLADRKIRIWVYKSEDRTKAAEAALERVQQEFHDKKIDAYELGLKDPLVDAGTIIFDMPYTKTEAVIKYDGTSFWQALLENHYADVVNKKTKTGKLLLGKYIEAIGEIKTKKRDISELEKLVGVYIREKKGRKNVELDLPIEDLINFKPRP